MDEPITPLPLTDAQLTKRQELNNHIVLMRKAVRRSRVHLINKLVREAKKLNARKGEEKEQEKSKRRASRLLEEVAVLKHLKEDTVSTYALLDKKSLDESITGPDTTPESRALAKLGHHQFVQFEVLKYRGRNPHWELQIPVLLGKSKEKQKKTQKKQEKKEVEKLKGPTVPDDKSDILIKPTVPDDDAQDSDSSSKSHSPEPKLDKRAIKKQKLILKAQRKNNKLDKSEGTIKIQHLKSLADLERSSATVVKSKRVVAAATGTEQPLPAATKRPRSSFFIGGTEEEEEKPEVRHYEDRKSDKPRFSDRDRHPRDNPNSKPIFRKGKLVSKPQPNRFGGGRREGAPSFRTPRYFDKQQETKPRNNNNNYQEQSRTSRREVEPSTAGAKLHPSWEAKKRQAQVSIPAFQGKKIAFTDDD